MWRNFSRKFHDAAAVAARIDYRSLYSRGGCD
jgi:hypothetical protein